MQILSHHFRCKTTISSWRSRESFVIVSSTKFNPYLFSKTFSLLHELRKLIRFLQLFVLSAFIFPVSALVGAQVLDSLLRDATNNISFQNYCFKLESALDVDINFVSLKGAWHGKLFKKVYLRWL